ncbi:hypothetical protein Q6D67_20885 [Haliea sp. E1-2-M8]|uniref:hypothetical protein n=1 Tax=Haliea sp. E1-2-M8 TaxID=3064706 RepID=UPI002716644B|nr:hypothetical protein [Haliea sp. E1-2-M8]MDO8864146.1 hypothetical protein [Haliea sp. E1-2-M8]
MSQVTAVPKSAEVNNQRKTRKLSNDAIKKLELEYFKKRRELEREQRIKARAGKAEKLAEAKKIITQLRKDYGMADAQIVKRLGVKI